MILENRLYYDDIKKRKSMIQKRNEPSAGFSLIEMMIVIAIISILAAVAIPNFISYRNKSFCTMAESDAEYILSGITDYFAVPTHTTYPVNVNVTVVDLGSKSFDLSGLNTATISGPVDAILVTVTDTSNRCPAEYRAGNSQIWVGGGRVVHRKM